jgi:hypothetical protein
VARWTGEAGWRAPHRLWILDPEGRPVLGYAPDVATADVLDDLRRLLRMNPEPPMARFDQASSVVGGGADGE